MEAVNVEMVCDVQPGNEGPVGTVRDPDGNTLKLVERPKSVVKSARGVAIFDGERVPLGQAKIKGLLTGFPERIRMLA